MNPSLADSPVAESQRGRRRTCLVNPAFQRKYTIVVAFGVLLVSSFMSYVLFGVLHEQARWRILHPEAVHAWQNTATIFLAGCAFSAVLAAAFGLWAYVITHCICGPMFVMERYLADLSQGRLPNYRPLRKKDEFKAFHAALWQAIDAMRAAKRSDVDRLTRAVEIAQSAANGDENKRKKALESLISHMEAMRAEAVSAVGDEPADTPATRVHALQLAAASP